MYRYGFKQTRYVTCTGATFVKLFVKLRLTWVESTWRRAHVKRDFTRCKLQEPSRLIKHSSLTDTLEHAEFLLHAVWSRNASTEEEEKLYTYIYTYIYKNRSTAASVSWLTGIRVITGDDTFPHRTKASRRVSPARVPFSTKARRFLGKRIKEMTARNYRGVIGSLRN